MGIVMEKTVGRTTAFKGRLLHVEILDVVLENGQQSTREVIRHPGAVAILAQLPDDRYVFVRQFRAAIGRPFLEIVAGTLHSGEDPADCARRELREETGYRARELVRLGYCVPAPGYTDERLHLYYARLDPEQGRSDPDPDEHVEVVALERTTFEAMLAAGEIEDGKTQGAWLLYRARQR